MALNPSCNNVEGIRLPVLGDPPFSAEYAEIAKKELLSIIPDAVFTGEERTKRVYKKGTVGAANGYVVSMLNYYTGQADDIEEVTAYTVEYAALGWTFRRAWYYWVCLTKEHPIPEEAARTMNESWGGQIRVDGFAGGTDVDGPVTAYHVDTLEGLARLVEEIRATHRSIFPSTDNTRANNPLSMAVAKAMGRLSGERQMRDLAADLTQFHQQQKPTSKDVEMGLGPTTNKDDCPFESCAICDDKLTVTIDNEPVQHCASLKGGAMTVVTPSKATTYYGITLMRRTVGLPKHIMYVHPAAAVPGKSIKHAELDTIKIHFDNVARAFAQPASREEQVRNLAYKLWLQRGSPIGSSEVDWEEANNTIPKDISEEE